MSKSRLEQLKEVFSKEELEQLKSFSEYNENEITTWLASAPDKDPNIEKFNQGHHLLSHLFYRAAQTGDVRTIQMFLSKNIYPNKSAHTLHGALRAAKQADQKEVVKLLLGYGLVPQKKLQYQTMEEDGVLVATLFIVNRFDFLTAEEVKNWFNEVCFKDLEITQLDQKIKISVKNTQIYRVLNVLQENFLTLDMVNLKLFKKEFVKMGGVKTQLRRVTVKTHKDLIDKYQGIILAFEKIYEEFWKKLPELDKAKIYKKRPVSKKEKPVETNLISNMINHIFQDITPEEMTDHIANQWVANAPSPVCDQDMLESTTGFVNELNNYNVRCKLETEKLSDETKAALQNIIVYGEKLWKERDVIVENSSEKRKLTQKIDALSTFIHDLVIAEELNEKKIKKLYNVLEKNDCNRGFGFYKFFTAAKGMWYIDEKGDNRAVKSTMGELGYYVMKALLKQVDAEEMDNKHHEESSESASARVI